MSFVSNATNSHFQLCSKTQILDDIAELPISDKSKQELYLIRHGESTANVYFKDVDGKEVRYVSGKSPEIHLTENGREQIIELAKKLAERFPEHAPIIVTCSSAMRTRQSAEIIFRELKKTHPGVFLTEKCEGMEERSLGEWEGRIKDQNYDKAEAPWRAFSAADKFISPEVAGGESYSEVANRALSAIAELYEKYSDITVIVVTSFNTINAAVLKINNVDEHLPTEPGTNFPKLHLGNGDLVLLETSKDGTQVVSHIKRF